MAWSRRTCRSRGLAPPWVVVEALAGRDTGPALLDLEDEIGRFEHGPAMADDDRDRAFRAALADGGQERGGALAVEVGVRLVEQQQAGRAIDRASQADALAHAARERAAVVAEHGVVAARHAADGFVDGGAPGAWTMAPRSGSNLPILSAMLPSSRATDCGR